MQFLFVLFNSNALVLIVVCVDLYNFASFFLWKLYWGNYAVNDIHENRLPTIKETPPARMIEKLPDVWETVNLITMA